VDQTSDGKSVMVASVDLQAKPLHDIGWWYPTPDPRYPELTARVALYAGPLDEVTVDGEKVQPQPGGFYGGWITTELVGPFRAALEQADGKGVTPGAGQTVPTMGQRRTGIRIKVARRDPT